MTKPNYQLQTLGRALDLLSWLESRDKPKTLTEIAEGLDFTPPMALRIIRTLVSKGFVAQVGGGKHYVVPHERDRLKDIRTSVEIISSLTKNSELTAQRIAEEVNSNAGNVLDTLKIMQSYNLVGQNEIGKWYLFHNMAFSRADVSSIKFRERLRPVLEVLHSRTDETVALFFTNGANQVVIDVIQTSQPLRYVLELGSVYPLFRGAAGKAALAWEPQAVVSTILESQEFKATGLDSNALILDLAAIRKRGYSISQGERVKGAVAVGANIFLEGVHTHAVINLTAPEQRAELSILHEWGHMLIGEVAAAGLSVQPKNI